MAGIHGWTRGHKYAIADSVPPDSQEPPEMKGMAWGGSVQHGYMVIGRPFIFLFSINLCGLPADLAMMLHGFRSSSGVAETPAAD